MKVQTQLIKPIVIPPPTRNGNYDWNAYHHGNIIQKWWKQKLCKKIISMVGESPVIDVGCGSSPMLSLIKADLKLGIDISLSKIEFIQAIDKTSAYSTYDGGTLPIPDGYFNTVICSEVIEHHPKPSFLMSELTRICRKDGVIIIATPDFSSLSWNLIEKVYGLLMPNGYKSEHHSKFTLTGITALAESNGLTFEKMDYILNADMIVRFKKL